MQNNEIVSLEPQAIYQIKATKYRNCRIGEFLKELKLTEGRNTGVPKIKRALKNNGSKEPVFETNDTRDYFITTIFMREGFEDEIKKRPVIHQDTNQDTNQDKILEFCKEPKTTKEIMAYLKLKDRRNFWMLFGDGGKKHLRLLVRYNGCFI